MRCDPVIHMRTCDPTRLPDICACECESCGAQQSLIGKGTLPPLQHSLAAAASREVQQAAVGLKSLVNLAYTPLTPAFDVPQHRSHHADDQRAAGEAVDVPQVQPDVPQQPFAAAQWVRLPLQYL